MKRLTGKGEEYKTLTGLARHLVTINSISKEVLRKLYCMQYDKLQKFEDLEEQIGMPLEDFYKCISHDDVSFFIVEKNEDNDEFEIIEVFKEDGYMHNYSQGKFMFCGHAYDTNENYYEISFGNYGKDLFLTREEAEKKLEEIKNENA